ncbi:MAG: hypothetical protein DMG31_00110 [Acidobacteria bacterium]|nr:MAG: hypothetical protein DMG31_00110 [Acidobacteriota bacterium]
MPDGAAGSTETLGAFRMNTCRKMGRGIGRMEQPMIEIVERQKGLRIRPFLPHKKVPSCRAVKLCDLTPKIGELMVLRNVGV